MLSLKIITFILPSPGISPTGGYKVAYEYANRLVADGYQVNIVYAGSIFWSQKTLYYKITNCIRYIQRWIKGYSCRKWFALDKRVKEVFAFSLNYRHVPHSDIYIATSPYTAMYVKDYPVNSMNKYYFIQGYENWGNVTDEMLRNTYHYELNKIVISTWLGDIMRSEKVDFSLIPNGFDFNYFRLYKNYKFRNKYQIAMSYNTTPLKGCKYAIEALNIVKSKYPQIAVNVFGTTPRPDKLPSWYKYQQCPNKTAHNGIYNESAIFIATSLNEGWGLTIGEAMICGAAVACTDNLGYREMAKDRETALLSPIKDSEALANNIIRLIEDDELRYRIAENGHRFIQQFTWESSYKKLLQVLNLK